jgi:hypothetical protein
MPPRVGGMQDENRQWLVGLTCAVAGMDWLGVQSQMQPEGRSLWQGGRELSVTRRNSCSCACAVPSPSVLSTRIVPGHNSHSPHPRGACIQVDGQMELREIKKKFLERNRVHLM